MAATRPTQLHFTGDAEADALLAEDPLALLIGFVLDQQVPVQKAFAGPLALKRRLGGLDAAQVAGADSAQLERVFAEKPAIHRFPAAMARRVQELCAAIVSEHGGDAAGVWRDAVDARDLERRLLALPGIGEMKAKSLLAVLGKRFGVRPDGWDGIAPRYPTLGDVDSPEALAEYQSAKRAYKASLRARRETG